MEFWESRQADTQSGHHAPREERAEPHRQIGLYAKSFPTARTRSRHLQIRQFHSSSVYTQPTGLHEPRGWNRGSSRIDQRLCRLCRERGIVANIRDLIRKGKVMQSAGLARNVQLTLQCDHQTQPGMASRNTAKFSSAGRTWAVEKLALTKSFGVKTDGYFGSDLFRQFWQSSWCGEHNSQEIH